MKRNGHLYEAFIDQGFTHNNNVANLGEEMRMFVSEVNIRVLGYLVGEGENDDRPIVRVEENVVEITYPQEGIVKDPEGFIDITS
jgi:fructose-1,6-bisphosphatase/sedoheptulose 1,7-bisphosphatase-like protein